MTLASALVAVLVSLSLAEPWRLRRKKAWWTAVVVATAALVLCTSILAPSSPTEFWLVGIGLVPIGLLAVWFILHLFRGSSFNAVAFRTYVFVLATGSWAVALTLGGSVLSSGDALRRQHGPAVLALAVTILGVFVGAFRTAYKDVTEHRHLVLMGHLPRDATVYQRSLMLVIATMIGATCVAMAALLLSVFAPRSSPSLSPDQAILACSGIASVGFGTLALRSTRPSGVRVPDRWRDMRLHLPMNAAFRWGLASTLTMTLTAAALSLAQAPVRLPPVELLAAVIAYAFITGFTVVSDASYLQGLRDTGHVSALVGATCGLAALTGSWWLLCIGLWTEAGAVDPARAVKSILVAVPAIVASASLSGAALSRAFALPSRTFQPGAVNITQDQIGNGMMFLGLVVMPLITTTVTQPARPLGSVASLLVIRFPVALYTTVVGLAIWMARRDLAHLQEEAKEEGIDTTGWSLYGKRRLTNASPHLQRLRVHMITRHALGALLFLAGAGIVLRWLIDRPPTPAL